ncbi:MAG: DUF1801 domain-containing protein [Verrucomicrobiales bacterium]|nr:DUF1801 domain-containing protein [Verrucomicrobiales bacterium]
MQSSAATVAAYLKEQTPERCRELETVRAVINANLQPGFTEGMQYGMIGWFVPHSIYPKGYHANPKEPLPFVCLASQKAHLSLYMFSIYTGTALMEEFHQAWAATGKKLNMGKSCIRFKKAADLALDVIGQTLAKIPVTDFIEHYEAAVARDLLGRKRK